MNIAELSKKELLALPARNRNEEMECSSLILIPLRRLHDSGFRCLEFIACIDYDPICRCSGISDVLHLDGIGGYGYQWWKKGGEVPTLTIPSCWSMDCLKKSGLFRIWPASGRILVGAGRAGSFEIYALPKPF